jgi:WD40 repeat protein
MYATGWADTRPGIGTRILSSLLLLFMACIVLFSPATAAEVSGKLLWFYKADSDVVDLAITPGGEWAVGVDLSEHLIFLNRSGTLIKKYWTMHPTSSVAVSSGAERVAFGRPDGGVTVLTTKGVAWSSEVEGGVQSLAMASDGTYVVVGSLNKCLSLLDADGNTVWRKVMDSAVYAVDISSVSDTIAAGTGWRLVLYTGEGEELWNRSLGGSVVDLALSKDGSTVGVVTSRKRLLVFNRQGSMLWDSILQVSPLSVGVSPEGSYLAIGAVNGVVTLFSRDGTQLHVFPTGGRVNAVGITSGAEWIVAGSADNYIYFFDGIPGEPRPATPTPTVTELPTGESTMPGSTQTAIPQASGNLSVTSIPDDALVMVDGLYYGYTPLTITDLSPGGHWVKIDAVGLEPANYGVLIEDGETKTLDVELGPRPSPTWPAPTQSGSLVPVAIIAGFLACIPAILGRRRLR